MTANLEAEASLVTSGNTSVGIKVEHKAHSLRRTTTLVVQHRKGLIKIVEYFRSTFWVIKLSSSFEFRTFSTETMPVLDPDLELKDMRAMLAMGEHALKLAQQRLERKHSQQLTTREMGNGNTTTTSTQHSIEAK